MLSGGVLQLKQREGKAIDHNEDVGTTVLAVLHNCELVGHDPVVVRRLFEINQPEACGPQLSVIVTVFNRHAFGDELVQPRVLIDRILGPRTLNRLDCFINQ